MIIGANADIKRNSAFAAGIESATDGSGGAIGAPLGGIVTVGSNHTFDSNYAAYGAS